MEPFWVKNYPNKSSIPKVLDDDLA
jgi:hypothetical protein